MSTTRINGRIPVALMVDDDAMMRLLIRQALEREGFACHEARTVCWPRSVSE